MLKSIKIRIYPNEEQSAYIARLTGSCRFVYNKCLEFKISEYNKSKHSVTFGELGKYLVSMKTAEETSWLSDVHSKVLQQSLINLEAAYNSFFKNGTGFPKFKSKRDSRQSCRFPADAIGKIRGNRIDIIRQLKDVHFKCSTKDESFLNKNQRLIRSATLVKSRTGKCHFSILIDRTEDRIVCKTNKVVGVDVGIKTFVTCSDGMRFQNIKSIRSNENKLKALHMELSRKIIGSKNQDKARIKLARAHERINNIKENYLHEVTNRLLDDNQVVVIEDLSVRDMISSHMAKSIQELSIGRFDSILEYKAEWRGRDVIRVDRYFPSSKRCHVCGHINSMLTLADREWKCPSCGIIHDRDSNAAINLEYEGTRILNVGQSSSNLKPLEIQHLAGSMN